MKKCTYNTESDFKGSLNLIKITEEQNNENEMSFSDFKNMLKEKCEKSNIKIKFVKK